jgi:futalosine hydrolase
MNVFVVAATSMELDSIANCTFESNHEISFHTHGIGILQSTFQLQKLAILKPDFIIQFGIAGSYNQNLSIGEPVIVASEQLGDCGAEDHEQLLTLNDLGFQDKNEFPFVNNILSNPYTNKHSSHLKKVNSLTVNLSAGNLDTIRLRKNKFKVDIESMEGACLHYVCLEYGIPFVQLRGISNYVEPRNKSKWNIPLALSNCKDEVIQLIQTL